MSGSKPVDELWREALRLGPRSAARQGEAVDTSTSHIGFRVHRGDEPTKRGWTTWAGPDSHVDSHGKHSRYHPVDPVDGSRAGDRLRMSQHHAMDGGQADF